MQGWVQQRESCRVGCVLYQVRPLSAEIKEGLERRVRRQRERKPRRFDRVSGSHALNFRSDHVTVRALSLLLLAPCLSCVCWRLGSGGNRTDDGAATAACATVPIGSRCHGDEGVGLWRPVAAPPPSWARRAPRRGRAALRTWGEGVHALAYNHKCVCGPIL